MKKRVALAFIFAILVISFVSAQKFELNNDNPKTEVNINEIAYTIELVSATDNVAVIKVTGNGKTELKEINEGNYKEVNGIKITISKADETNLRLSVSIIVGEDIDIEEFQKLTLSSETPRKKIASERGKYDIELVSASDTSAVIKVSQMEEIFEFNTEEIGGLKIELDKSEETNLELFTEIKIEKEEAKIELNTDFPKNEIIVNDKQYIIELVSATDTSATIKVIDSTGKSDMKEINENTSKEINGIIIIVKNSEETNLELSVSIMIEKVSKIKILTDLTNLKPKKDISMNGEIYTIELVSATDNFATFKVSQTKEISEGNIKMLEGLEIKLLNADETNLRFDASMTILNLGKFEIEEFPKQEIPKKEEITPTEDTGPIKIPENKEEEEIVVCNGCLLEDSCYPLGYRKDGKFCSENKEFVAQLEVGIACDNNFECGSNICIAGECISPGLIQKILNWFKRAFGFD